MYSLIIYNNSPNIKESYQLLQEIKEKSNSTTFTPRKVDKPLILYGKGNLGKMAKEYFETINIPISNIIDKDNIQDIPIEQRKKSLLAICIVTTPFSEITSSLKKQGFTDIVPFYDISQAYINMHPLNNGWYTTYTFQEALNIKDILSRLEDNISRAHYLQFIAWRILRQELKFYDAPITTDNRYFIPETISILDNNETFVDIGAHHGEVSLKFIDIINEHKRTFPKIYVFEPDENNYHQMRKNFMKSTSKFKEPIELNCKALSSEPGKKTFHSGLGYASQISDTGNVLINVEKLDNLNFITPPTFIKIHTEGNEGDVIEGAKETITKNRPILTVTCYHNQNGLCKLPLQIMNETTKYTYYFRLHSWCGTGAVIYAIPKER